MSTSLTHAIAKSLENVSAWEFTRVEVRSAGIVFCCRYRASGSFVELFYQVDEEGTSCIPIQVGGGIYQRDLDQLVHIGMHVILPQIRADIFCHRLGISRDVVSDEVVEILFPYLGKEGLRRLLCVLSWERIRELSITHLRLGLEFLMGLEHQGEHISGEWMYIWTLEKAGLEELREAMYLIGSVGRETIETCVRKLRQVDVMQGELVLFCVLYAVVPVGAGCFLGKTKDVYVRQLCDYVMLERSKKEKLQRILEQLVDIRGVAVVLKFFEEIFSVSALVLERCISFLQNFALYASRVYIFVFDKGFISLCSFEDSWYLEAVEQKLSEEGASVLIDIDYFAKTIRDRLQRVSWGEFPSALRVSLHVFGDVMSLEQHRFSIESESFGFVASFATGTAYINYVSPTRGGIFEIYRIQKTISLLGSLACVPVELFDKSVPFISVEYQGITLQFVCYRYVDYLPFVYGERTYHTLLISALYALHGHQEVSRKPMMIKDYIIGEQEEWYDKDFVSLCEQVDAECIVVSHMLGHNDLHRGNLGIRDGACIFLDVPAIMEMSVPEILAQLMIQQWKAQVNMDLLRETLQEYIYGSTVISAYIRDHRAYVFVYLWVFLCNGFLRILKEQELPEEWSHWEKLREFFHGIIREE